MIVKSYRDLIAWQKSMDLALLIYSITESFPPKENYGLTSQVRRAAVSVASNIAEGHSRNNTGEFKQFLGIAYGSLAELETQIMLSNKLGYIDGGKTNDVLTLASETGKIINGIKSKL
jgi:four helix bundle protein